MVYFDCHLANTDTTKIVTPEITTNGPVGRFKKLELRIPAKALTAPKTALRTAYLKRSELRFFAAAAGTMTRKPTRRVPTILIPTATTRDTRRR